jgi:hypothetical protein
VEAKLHAFLLQKWAEFLPYSFVRKKIKCALGMRLGTMVPKGGLPYLVGNKYWLSQ